MFDKTDLKEPASTLEKDRKRIEKVLCSATDRTLSTWAMADDKTLTMFIDAACHAAFRIPKGMLLLASCFDTRMTKNECRKKAENGVKEFSKEDGEKFWSFMTGENSPWKKLFEKSYPERIEDENGQLVGFFMNPETAYENKGLTLNYCIAMRMVGEERRTIKTWSTLVDLGMREADALYLSRMIAPVTSEQEEIKGLYTEHGYNDTCHWPLLNNRYGPSYTKYIGSFNFKAFREGEFNSSLDNETHGWCTAPFRADFSLARVKNKVEHRYSSFFKLEDVVEEFTNWVDAQEQKKEKVAA
jgi:hypothetical protein